MNAQDVGNDAIVEYSRPDTTVTESSTGGKDKIVSFPQ
jgi:hypothetical protein